MKKYNPSQIEKKWQKYWQEHKTFAAKDFAKQPKEYILAEFPYPSGEGLHMGHLRPYVAGDTYSRFKRLQGYDVLYPMGWDAFGLPAENFAIKKGVHPSITTAKNIKNAKRQLQSWGMSFDWNREINTTDPDYYKWTQWIFLQFFKAGLAYEATGVINWCPKDKTGLANEEVVDGKCERCGTPVEKKELRQWYLKITAYAEKLLEGLKDLPQWPEAVKLQQANWIGKSTGAEIEFKIKDTDQALKIFTTRPDTIFGATYMVVAPEHPIIENLKLKIENFGEVRKYIEKTKSETEIQRTSLEKEKTGVELKGIKAVNPATGGEIPVWAADYVLMGYGTGAIMAVPAHDERDFAFAKKFNLPIKQVVQPVKEKTALLLHGTGGNGNNNWFPWLKEKLQNLGYKVFAPDLPDAEHPTVQNWLGHLKQYADQINESSLVVGHSLGCPAALQFLQKYGKKINQLVLVAPTHPDMDWNQYRKQYPKPSTDFIQKFSQSRIDWDRLSAAANHIDIFMSEDDPHIPIKVKELYERDLEGAKVTVFKDKGHFGKTAGLKDLPELMDVVVEHPPVAGSGELQEAYAGDGVLVNSGKFDGLKSDQAIPKMAAEFGKLTVQYKLRDWVFSRQRYWGEPIPLIHCEDCGIVPVPEKDLPVKLPKVKKYEPTGTGESPLADIKSWVKTKCPVCKKLAWRETNTMPQWAGSSWYWLRYADPKDKKTFADKKKQKFWTPVDVYFGGMEHTTLHLLYSRFWNLFLYDQGLVTAKEPFTRRLPHGIILASDGEKMSKSRGNVVNPDEIVKKFGADTLRMYEMFLGPHEMTVSWNDQGVLGVRRFLERVWVWVNEKTKDPKTERWEDPDKAGRALHRLIKKVTEDLENFRYNTAISSFMEFHNEIRQEQISSGSIRSFLTLLYPFAPHICEELNQLMGSKKSLQLEKWPAFDPEKIVEQNVDIVVQLNGKVRGKVTVPFGSKEEQVKAEAMKLEPIQKALAGTTVKRAIYVPNRLINLVI